MKDLLRRHAILKDEVVSALNKQVKIEAQSSNHYLALAAWCHVRGYDNSSEFFYKQSKEERKHQLKIFKYLNDMESEAKTPGVDESEFEFSTLREVFEKALDMEVSVTESIHDLVRVCRKADDIQTEEFLRWFVKEQIEEEYVARQALELFEILGEDKLALAMFEERILEIEYDG
ncbi:MAG: ferritin [Cyclobacteriaceae bacterium]|nr:ferritin [Cyclobacteriaceae bacterium]MCH8516443.1 ferritin [Cyclobacteriaceae bacterium]